MKRVVLGGLAATMLAATGMTVHGSSHREALAILNEPCADNTDTYAWVSNASHDKLYLIMDFNPLHEPGQGNQGLRACNGYRYEFHIAKGKSLKDNVVYRVEFTNRLTPEAAPSASDPLGGGNELLWQLTGGTETMKVTRIAKNRDDDDDDDRRRSDDEDGVVLGGNLPVLPNNHVEAQLDNGDHRHRLAVDDRWRELPLTRRGNSGGVEQRDRARHLGVAHRALRIDRDLDRHCSLDARPHRFGSVGSIHTLRHRRRRHSVADADGLGGRSA